MRSAASRISTLSYSCPGKFGQTSFPLLRGARGDITVLIGKDLAQGVRTLHAKDELSRRDGALLERDTAHHRVGDCLLRCPSQFNYVFPSNQISCTDLLTQWGCGTHTDNHRCPLRPEQQRLVHYDKHAQ